MYNMCVLVVLGRLRGVELENRWDPCPVTMTKGGVTYSITVSNGNSTILQPPDSEVCLQIPEGSTGVYILGIDTDFSEFLTAVSEDECFISPVVKIIHVMPNRKIQGTHFLKIPHSIRNKSHLDAVTVKKTVSEDCNGFIELPQQDEVLDGTSSYSVYPDYVRVSCNSFSDFVCISCRKTCLSSIKAFIFSKLKNRPGISTRAPVSTLQVISFLCGSLCGIEEFREVSHRPIFLRCCFKFEYNQITLLIKSGMFKSP